MDHLRLGVRDLPGQHDETPSLPKIQKLAECGGECLYSQLLGRLRWKNRLNSEGGGCSELRLCHCTSAWVTECLGDRMRLCLKKIKNISITDFLQCSWHHDSSGLISFLVNFLCLIVCTLKYYPPFLIYPMLSMLENHCTPQDLLDQSTTGYTQAF